MDYNLKKSNRNTISIRVTKDATLEVRAPKKMPVRSIEQFLEQKDEWIQKHISEALEKKRTRESFELNFGSTISLRGIPCEIFPTEQNTPIGPVKAGSSYRVFIPEFFSNEQIIETVRKLLIEYAKDFIPKRTSNLAKIMEVSPTSVRVGKANTRWGSCNSQGRINFSWKIIMCPDSVVDYVIIHELCHLLHLNHSQRFWDEVQKYSPNYKVLRCSLKEYSKQLDGETW